MNTPRPVNIPAALRTTAGERMPCVAARISTRQAAARASQ